MKDSSIRRPYAMGAAVKSSMSTSRSEDRTVRRLGILLFPLALLEGGLGVASAGQEPSTASALLVFHVSLGVGVVALAGFAVWAALRRPGRAAQVATGFTAACLVATGSTGAAFLVAGSSQGLIVDRLLATFSLAGTVLMIIFGRQQTPY